MAKEDAKFTINDHTAKMLARLPDRHQDSTNLRAWLSIYGDRIQALEDVIRDINANILFNIETATTVEMDQIGTIIEMPRDGRTDDDYRIVLRTQATLVLPDRRNVNTMLEIVRSLLDTPAGMINYFEFRPKTYQLDVPSATITQLISWVPILRRTRPVTYNAILRFSVVGHFSFSDASAVPLVEAWEGYSDATGAIGPLAWDGYSGRIIF